VRQYLEEHYGPTALYRGGFAVETTLDMRLQQIAEQTLPQGLVAIDRRHGLYHGPIRRLEFTGDAATDAKMIEAALMLEEGDTIVREGERLQGVVLAVQGAGATVAIKNTRGLLPPAGYAWVRHIDPALSADLRRQLLRRGDVIQVRVTR